MLFEFISMIVAGLGAAGIVLALDRFTGRRFPRWAMPAAAGVTMLGFSIWNEYDWAGRSIAQFPDTAAVTFKNQRSDLWRPWTYLAPVTTRMAIMDRGPEAGLSADPGPDFRLARLYLMERWKPTYAVTILFDCAKRMRADAIVNDAIVTDPAAADWQMTEPDDVALGIACKGEANG